MAAVDTEADVHGPPTLRAARQPGPAAKVGRKVVQALSDGWSWLAAPGLILLVGFFGAALVLVVHQSISGVGLSNYKTIFTSLYLHTLESTFRAALFTAVTTLVLGYSYAFAMVAATKPVRVLLILVLVAEFATSWLARAYAWYMLLQTTGVINHLLITAHIIRTPLTLMRNDLGMIVGTTHLLLPYMVLVLYASMRQVDMSTMLAAQSLGAKRYQAFWRIFVPATRPGIIAGAGLVFLLTLGFYITPALLGDPSHQMISALIVTQTEQLGNFGLAAAMSTGLLVVTLLTLFIVSAVAARTARRMPGGRAAQ